MHRSFGIGPSRFGITQTLMPGVLRIGINIPTEGRHFPFVQFDKRQLFGIRRPCKQSGDTELLFVQPIGCSVDDIRIRIFGHRYFGTEIALMDIEVIIFYKRHITPVRTHDRVAHFTQVESAA